MALEVSGGVAGPSRGVPNLVSDFFFSAVGSVFPGNSLAVELMVNSKIDIRIEALIWSDQGVLDLSVGQGLWPLVTSQ